MNKKLFKKVLTAVLTAAMLITSSGVASLNASAADDNKVYVEGVYTNFQKATMAIQTTRQIKAYVEPGNATVQKFQYKSSAPEVAKVSGTGLITAQSAGKATITVTALDGSSQKETIVITVLEDLTITNKNVDSDNEVIVLDKTLGNIYIDSSVGDADIYLGGVTVRNILAMDSGDYSLYMYDSTVKELKIDELPGEIESFAIVDDDKKAPSLIIGENAQINDLNARISASIRQEDGSAVEGLRVTQTEDGRIVVYLENYSGGLLLDASLGDLEIVTTGCNLFNVNVSGNDNAGSVVLTNGGDSEITNLTLNGAANVNLGVPANAVNISSNAGGASLSSSSSIGTLRNAGSRSNITISGSVDNLEANGENGNINVAAGGYVGTANLSGAGSTLSGAGEVSEAYVNANNISVNTVNTLLTVGNVTGTKSQGNDIAGGSTVATEPPAGGGGPGGGPGGEEPEKPIKAGDIIVENDFEDGKNNLQITMTDGNVKATIVDGGKDSAKALRVSSRTQTYHGVGFNFGAYLKKRATVRIKLDIKCAVAPESGNGKELKATIKTEGTSSDYNTVASLATGEADTWYTLEGTFELANNITAAYLYIEAPGTNDYYLDNVIITVDRIGDPIPVTGISIDPASLDSDGSITIDINQLKILTAIVTPDTADNKAVTWTSANPLIATVEEGVVKGIDTGSTKVTAKTVDGNYTAEVNVTVTDQVLVEIPASENFEKKNVGDKLTWLGYGGGDGEATVIVDPSNPFNKLLEVKPGANYDRAPIINIILPEGKTLADYSHIKYKALWKSGDIGWKDVKVEADKTLSGAFGKTPSRVIAQYSRAAGPTTALEEKELELNGNMGTISGTIQISIGINCLATEKDKPENPTVYYLDDIVLVENTTVPTPITGITLEPSTLTLAQNANSQLTATIEPEGFTTSNVITWTSDKPEVATVDATGKVTAKGPGKATITAATAIDGVSKTSFTKTCNVTVTSEVALTLDYETVILQSIGATHTLVASVTDGVVWSVTDNTIAGVAGGVITAKAFGTTTVTATLGSQSKISNVVVADNIAYYEDFEDGTNSLENRGDWASKVTVITNNSIAYNGSKYLEAETLNSGNGDMVLLDNSTGSLEATFVITTYLRAHSTDIAVHYWNHTANTAIGSPITVKSDAWTKLVSPEIKVAAGESIKVRITTNAIGKFLMDCLYITKTLPETSGVEPADRITFDFEAGAPTVSGINANAEVIPMTQMQTEVGESKVLKVVHNGGYNSVPKFTINLPAGTSFSDYKELSLKYYLANEDSNNKNASLFVGNPITYSGWSLDNDCNYFVSQGFQGTGTWKDLKFDLTTPKNAVAVSGSAIEIGIGMNAGTGATFMFDDITLVPVSGSAIVVESFEGTVPTIGKAGGGADFTTSVDTMTNFMKTNESSKVLKVTNTNWHGAVKLNITIPDGNKLSDFASLKFKLYLPSKANTFKYKSFTVSIGTDITSVSIDPTNAPTINEVVNTGENIGKWYMITSTITDAIKEDVGNATEIEIALGCGQNLYSDSYYIDDIVLEPITLK